MRPEGTQTKVILFWLTLLHLVYFGVSKGIEALGVEGIIYANGTPVGGDFINMWTAARLVLSDRTEAIYQVGQFMAAQEMITGGADIGLRLWAYPPHSLLLVWPLAILGYYAALAVWSLLGLAVLGLGARRFGFDRMETFIILASPATLLNLYFGQTGSFAAGLLLLALSARSIRDPISIGAAAILTIKPQTGFLLPLLWAFQRRWWMIAATALAMAAILAMSAIVFGVEAWSGYLRETLPVLSALEREGSGAFMLMIPSAFMSMRILADQSGLEMAVHALFAVIVMVVLIVRLRRTREPDRQAAMLMIGTVLVTPYIHNYDLALLLCCALITAKRWERSERRPPALVLVVVVAWILPHLVVALNTLGIPAAPLLMLPLLFLA